METCGVEVTFLVTLFEGTQGHAVTPRYAWTCVGTPMPVRDARVRAGTRRDTMVTRGYATVCAGTHGDAMGDQIRAYVEPA